MFSYSGEAFRTNVPHVPPISRVEASQMAKSVRRMESLMAIALRDRAEGSGGETVSFLCTDPQMSHFPLQNKASFDMNEITLEENQFKERLIDALVNNGKFNNQSLTIHHIMKAVISFSLGQQYTLSGRIIPKKSKFSGTKLHNAVLQAVLRLYERQITVRDVDLLIGKWLTQCKTREDRQKSNNLRAPRTEAEPINLQ